MITLTRTFKKRFKYGDEVIVTGYTSRNNQSIKIGSSAYVIEVTDDLLHTYKVATSLEQTLFTVYDWKSGSDMKLKEVIE